MSPNNDLQVTPASQWKQARLGKLVELPSGRVVKVRTTFDIFAALREGFIPNPLAQILQGQIQGKSIVENLDSSALGQMDEFIQRIVCDEVIEPKFCMVPEGEDFKTWEPEDENMVSVMDLTSNDRSFIFQVVQGGTTNLETFRSQSQKPLGIMADEQVVESKAVKPTATRRPPRSRK